MEHMSRGRFQSIWSIVIVLCALLAVITVFVVSCTPAPEGDVTTPKQTKTDKADATPVPNMTVIPSQEAAPTPDLSEASAEQGETEAPDQGENTDAAAAAGQDETETGDQDEDAYDSQDETETPGE